jgi:hypothetical protein
MSLINDALKRASESDKDRPHQAETPPAMQQPVMLKKEPKKPWILPVAILVVLIAAGLFFWKGWPRRTVPAPAKPATPVVHTAAKPASAPVVTPAPLVTSTPVSVVTSAPVVAPTPPPAVVPVPVVTEPSAPVVWPADLSLQAIFYSKTHPHAFINGRSVKEGDTINGIEIKKIQPDGVQVEWSGQTHNLLLGGK